MSVTDIAEAFVELAAAGRQNAEPEIVVDSAAPMSVHVCRVPVLSRSACSSMSTIRSDGKSIEQNQRLGPENAAIVGNAAQQVHGQSQHAADQLSRIENSTDPGGYGAFSSSASANICQPLQNNRGTVQSCQQVRMTGMIIFQNSAGLTAEIQITNRK